MNSSQNVLKVLQEEIDKEGVLSEQTKEMLLRLFLNKDLLSSIKEEADFSKLQFLGLRERDTIKRLAKAVFEGGDITEIASIVGKEKLFDPFYRKPPHHDEVFSLYIELHRIDAYIQALLYRYNDNSLIYIPPVLTDPTDKFKYTAVKLTDVEQVLDDNSEVEEIRDLRYQLPVYRKQLCLLVGRTGVGKTTFCKNYSVSLAREGYKVLYVTREIFPRILVRYAKSIIEYFKDDPTVLENIYITEADTTALIKKTIEDIKPDVVIVDFLSLVSPSHTLTIRNKDEWQVISQTAKELLAIAKNTNTAILAIAQLTKEDTRSFINESSLLGGSKLAYISANIYVLDFVEVYETVKSKGKKDLRQIIEKAKQEKVRDMVLYTTKTRFSAPFELRLRFHTKSHVYEPIIPGLEETDKKLSGGSIDDYDTTISDENEKQDELPDLFTDEDDGLTVLEFD